MTRKTILSITFLSITAVAVGWELAAVVNPRDDLVPWTDLIADHVPPAVAWAAILLLISWIPGHFIEAYAKRGKIMDTIPATPEPDAPKEPLLSVGTVTAVAAAALAIAAAFGVPMSDELRGAILVLIGAAAPLIVAILARNKVFAPATVRAMVVTAAATGEVATEPTPAKRELA